MPEPDLEMNDLDPGTTPAQDQRQEESIQMRKGPKVWKLLVRRIWTVVFAIFIFAVAKIYLAKGNITKTQKATYNLIQTALILALGLNLSEVFTELKSIVQRRIRDWAECDHQESQLIAGIDSLLNVWRLLRKSYAKPRIAFFCVTWLAFILIAQIAVASISLTFSVDDGTDFQGTYIRDGTVNAANLSCYLHHNNFNHEWKCPPAVTRQALAHDYGEYASTSECGDYTEIAQVLSSKLNYPYYCRTTPHMQEFSYRFNEYNPNDLQKSYPFFSNRTVTAWSDPCFTYNETNRTPLPDVKGDGGGVKISYKNDTFNDSISIPNSSLGDQGTTYVYRGIRPPANATAIACGPRCITMWAYKNPKSENPRLYQCPINVSAVRNATQDAHNIPNGVARVAAASIALEGRFSGNSDFTQYQFYADGADWEIHYHSPDEVGANMAKFALHSLATMVHRNQVIRIPGSVPYLGSRLNVYWQYFIPLLSCIVGVHFLLMLVVVVWNTRAANDAGLGTYIAGDNMNESLELILGPSHSG